MSGSLTTARRRAVVGQIPVYLLFVVFAAACEGWAIASGRTKIAVLPLAAMLAIYALRKPMVLLAVPLAYLTVAGVNQYKASHLGVAEIILLAGVFLIAVRGELEAEPVGILIAGILGLSIVAIYTGESNGATFQNAFDMARDMLGYLAYFVALALLRKDRDRTLRVLGYLACAVAALTIVQHFFPSHHVFLDPSTEISQPGSGFIRVRPNGLIVYVAEFFAIACVIWGERAYRRRALWAAALFGASILISLNRNWVLGIVLGTATVWILGRPHHRSTMRVAGLVAVCAVMLAAASGTSVGDRILSLQNTSALQRGTLADRAYEDRFAKHAIGAHPLLGVGWAPYGAMTLTADGGTEPRTFIHNQYLGLWLRFGIVGLAAFVAALWIGFSRAVGSFRRDADWLAAGAAGALVGVASSAIVGIYILSQASAVGLATLLALCATFKPHSEAAEDEQRSV